MESSGVYFVNLNANLNLDVMTQICEWLEVDDVLQCALVCTKWNEFVVADRMWRMLWDRDMAYFATSDNSFDSHPFSTFRDAYAYFFAFCDTPIFELPIALDQTFIPDTKNVRNKHSSDNTARDCGFNHKTHEVGLAFRGETERLRLLLEKKEETGLDVNALQCYKHWLYYGNFSYGRDGFIYKPVDGNELNLPAVLDDLLSDADFSEGMLRFTVLNYSSHVLDDRSHLDFAIENSKTEYALDPLSHVHPESVVKERLELMKKCDMSRVYRVIKVERCSGETQEMIWRKNRNYCGTLLHWAALGNHLDTVQMLCEFGADVTIVVPKLNAKAIDIAKCNGSVEIYHYLKSCEKNL
jgi:hypothetical protein